MDATPIPPGDTVVDALAYHAREQPDGIAFTYLADGVSDERSLRFAEVEVRARAIATEIRRVAPDAERAMILQAPGLDFVVSLMACFMAGVAAVPTPLPAARANSNAAQRFAALMADAAPDVTLTHSDLLSRSRWLVEGQIGMSTRQWITTDTCRAEGSDQGDVYRVRPDDLALIQYTSGSTATPKGVMIDHANLAANLAAIQSKFELTRDSVVVSWLPPYHDMGLIGGVVSAMWCGYRVVLMDPKRFMARPLSWLEAIDRYKADVSGGANFAFDLCADALTRSGDVTLDLSRWRLAFSGAEPVRATTIERFTTAFAKYGFQRKAFYPCYGLAEATLIVTGPDPDAARPIETRFEGDASAPARTLVACGTPCADTTLEIVDPETGEIMPDGQEGEIRISGPAVTRGYWRQSATNASAPLASGDLGFLWQGQLYVTGRLKDLIIVRGRNIAPDDVEDAVARCHPALAPASSAAFPVDMDDAEGLVIAAEIRREHRRDTDWSAVFAAMRSRIVERTGCAPTDIVLLRPGTLARTTSGKIKRHACRQYYLADEWDPLARAADGDDVLLASAHTGDAAQRTPTENYLIGRLAQLTKTPESFISSDVAIQSVGLDSLKEVEFALLLERDLRVTLPVDWPERAETLGDLAALVDAAKPSVTESARDDLQPDKIVPLAPRQADFFDGAPERVAHFAEVLYFRVPKGADVAALERAYRALVDGHDAFSLRFEETSGHWRARIGDEGSVAAFERLDIGGLDKREFAAVRSDVLRRIYDAFSLSDGPLVAAVLLDRGAEEQGMLAVGFHHLVIDAVSLSAWAVRFQAAYDRERQGRPIDCGASSRAYVPWLRALDAYGQSSELADEVAYWTEMCGLEEGEHRREASADEGSGAWRAVGKTSVSAERNQILLERYRTPLARNALVFAAVCQAWSTVTGDPAPLVMMESHGRYPFPRTDPSTAIGWFAARYPLGLHVPPGMQAADVVSDAIARAERVPKLGHGYGLLRRKRPNDPLRVQMDTLRKPSILLQYRGNIDETFRGDAVFPVIAVHHEGRAFEDAARQLGDIQPLAVTAGLSDGALYWSVAFRPSVSERTAQAISAAMRDFFTALASK